jgi:uncharacterized protein YjiK
MAKYRRAKLVAEFNLGVQEASGLAELDAQTLLVVDDEAGIFRWNENAGAVPLDAGRGLSDLEGICLDSERRHAYVLVEQDGSIWRYAIARDELHGGERLGCLPRLSKKKNNGWEGLAWAAAGSLNEKALLVAAHQTKPRTVGFFCPRTLEPQTTFRLPKNTRKELGELNDIAVLPQSGELLALSGKSGRIARLEVCGSELKTSCFYRIATSKQDVPEGIAVAANGDVLICSDGKGFLRRLLLE